MASGLRIKKVRFKKRGGNAVEASPGCVALLMKHGEEIADAANSAAGQPSTGVKEEPYSAYQAGKRNVKVANRNWYGYHMDNKHKTLTKAAGQ